MFGNPLEGHLDHVSLIAYGIAFMTGVLTSFTPCIYPMIPITIGVIGGQEKKSRRHGFLLSLAYVVGLAVVYSLLGVIAAVSGRFFGEISANRWTLLIVANIIILFGLSMLDVFTLPIPSFLSGRRAGSEKRGLPGAFFMGMASGMVAAPCTTPVLGVLLAYVATSGNILYGSTLLFTFAMGMNVLLLVIGTFTGLLTSLPNSGMWMVRVKKLMGLIMIGVGEYFLIEAGRVWL